MARWSTLLPLGLILGSVVAAIVLILGAQGLPRLKTLRGELSYVRRSNAALRREVEHLHWEIRALRNDPTEIERVARDELGMLRPDEVIFQFDEPRAAQVADAR